jgi:hypothetical protein
MGDKMKTTQEIKTNIKRMEDEDNRTSSDTDTTMDDSVDSANIESKMTIPIIEVDEEMDREIDEYLSNQDSYSEVRMVNTEEKEDVRILFKQSSQSTSSELSDNSCTSDIRLSNINNFQEYGFTADFAGEILKEVGDRYIGYILNKDNKATAITWDANGVSTLGEPDTVWQGFRENYNTNLTQIKQHWYDDPANFPAMLIRDTEERMGYIRVDNKEQFIKRHRQGFRLITKAERDRLFCKE